MLSPTRRVLSATIPLLTLLAVAAPPGVRAQTVRLVGEGIVSTPEYEASASLTPDGRTLYFAKRPPVGYFWVICVVRADGGRWGEPEVAPFSGRYSDTDPFVSPDGSRLFFASNRPHGDGGAQAHFDLWMAERQGDGWGEPRPVEGVSSAAEELHPTVDREGTLYFASNRPGGGGMDIYRAAWGDGRYAEPVRLDSAVNSRFADGSPAISPDGRTLVFASVGRPDEPLLHGQPYARGDLYAAVRGPDGWAPARRLPDGINSPAAELAPAWTPDGARLLFTSERGFAMRQTEARLSYADWRAGLAGVENGLGNVYEVDAREVAP